MTTTSITTHSAPIITHKRTRHEVRAAINKRILKWFSIAVFLFLYLPIIILIIYSFNANKVVGVWTGFSTQWYAELIQDRQIISAFQVSMWVAVWTTVLSTILGTLIALSLERYRYRGKMPLDAMIYLPIIIPDIVMALSILLFFVIVAVPLSRYTVLLAHTAFNISFVAVIIRARLADMDPNLEQAAADLGANEWTTFRRVTLPLMMPGIVAGALLAFTLSLDDFVITFFVSGPGSTTLPVRVYSMIKFGVTPEVNAVSALMFVGSTLLVVLSLILQRKS
jgi:spermidine/putrescine transport system permease protein